MRTREEIQAKIAEIEADGRYQQPPAAVQVNAPLALIQTSLEATKNALQWVLYEKAETPEKG